LLGFEYVLKAAGAVLVLSSGIMIGCKLKKRMRMRKEILCEYRNGLEFLESRIVLDELALIDCMQDCEKKFCAKYPEYNIFSVFKKELSQGVLSAEESWLSAIDAISEKGLSEESEKELLSSLASTLGRSDINHHSDHIKDIVCKLDSLIAEAESKLKKDGNLYIKLGAAAAAVAVLLLW